jgi:hypothetical protein
MPWNNWGEKTWLSSASGSHRSMPQSGMRRLSAIFPLGSSISSPLRESRSLWLEEPAVSESIDPSRYQEVLGHLRQATFARPKRRGREFPAFEGCPFHPSLHFKKVGRYWSVRAGIQYRALRVRHEETMIWLWIGPHSEYDKLITE